MSAYIRKQWQVVYKHIHMYVVTEKGSYLGSCVLVAGGNTDYLVGTTHYGNQEYLHTHNKQKQTKTKKHIHN